MSDPYRAIMDEVSAEVLGRPAAAPAASATPAADPYRAIMDDVVREVVGRKTPEGSDERMTPVSKRGLGDEVLRQLGLLGRGVAGAVASLPAMAADAVIVTPYNAAADLVQGKGKGYRFPRQADAVDAALTSAGVPEPENAVERVAQDAMKGVGGAAGTLAAGKVLAKSAAPVTKAVGKMLEAGPGVQLTSGGAGAGTSAAVREAGGSEGEQLAAGVVAALVPGFAGPAVKAATRGALRGGEANRAKMAENIATFEAAGTTPTLGQATEGRVARAAESLLAKAPGGAGVIAKRAQTQADDMAAAVQKLSDELAPGASAVNAGEAIQRGIVAFKDGFKAVQKRLYQTLDRHIPEDARVDVTRTRAALADLNEDIAGAPELSKWFKNARIQGIESGLVDDSQGIAAVATRPGMPERIAAMRQQLQAEAAAVQSANAERRMLGMRNLEPEISPEQIDDAVNAYLTSQVDQRLTYEALRKLRTLVGNEISDGGLVTDVPRSKWRALYAALSDDLGDAAKQAGPEAQNAWQWANQYTKMQLQRLDDLEGIVGRDAPEKVFNAAVSGTSEGDTIIKRVIDALPKEERRQVAAAVIQRLGRATPGQQNAMGDAFSSETFLSNLSKLSPAARETIFGRTGVDGILDRVGEFAKVAGSRRDGGRIFANPSGTASSEAQLAYAGSMGAAAMSGNPIAIGGALAVPAVTYGAARAVTSPKVVKFAAGQTELPPGALPSTGNAGAVAGQTEQPVPIDPAQEFGIDDPDAGSAPRLSIGGLLEPEAPLEQPMPEEAPQEQTSAAEAAAKIASAPDIDSAVAAFTEAVAAPAQPRRDPRFLPVSQRIAEAQAAQPEVNPGDIARVWTGRRGMGFTDVADAARSLRTRMRVDPDLEWTIEPTYGGRLQLVGRARGTQAPVVAEEVPTVASTRRSVYLPMSQRAPAEAMA